MRIVDVYSHFNGLEYLLVRKPKLWKEIRSIIASVKCPSDRSKAKPPEAACIPSCVFRLTRVVRDFSGLFHLNGWEQRSMLHAGVRFDEDKITYSSCSKAKSDSSNQTDFVKDRVAIEVQFGKYAFVAYDLFVKHLAFYVRDQIDVGIEILPMKSLQAEMSSGPGYYEGELYNVIRNGRGVPAVPLVMIGIAP